MPQYFEDLEEQFASAKPRANLLAYVVFAAMGAAIVAAMYTGFTQVLYLLAFVLALVLACIVAWQNRQLPKLPPLICPSCQSELRADSIALMLSTRACQRCQYVFPSRAPPIMRRVQLDRSRLPRVWLQGEVPTASIVNSESAPPALAPISSGSDANPYQPPALAEEAETAAASQPREDRFMRPWGTLLWWWGAATVNPLRLLLQTDAQILANDNLAERRDVETERSRHMRSCYVRSVRRSAWVMLWCVNVPPLVAVWMVVSNLGEGDSWWLCLVLAIGLHGIATVICGIIYNLAIPWLPRPAQQWLAGGLTSILAETDPKTGYYGIRARLVGVKSQWNLPRLRFRFRQQRAGEVLLRVVNHDLAEALELPFPYETPGEWQAVEVDLLLLVRQSAPEFFGDEVHLTCDPAGELEICDYTMVARA